MLATDAAAKDFVTDAHAHCKFIGHTSEPQALLDAAGVADLIDDGYVALDGDGPGHVHRALPQDPHTGHTQRPSIRPEHGRQPVPKLRTVRGRTYRDPPRT